MALPEDGMTLYINGRIYGLDGDKRSWNHIQDISNGRPQFSLDAKTLAIGSRTVGTNGINSGRAMVYRWDEAASNYKQLANYINGKAAGDRFGDAVALSSNGTTLAVLGGWVNDDDERPGYAQVYKLENSTLLY